MVGGGVFPPCIIILWSEFVFLGCILGLYLYLRVHIVVFNYKVPFSIFELHAFFTWYKKHVLPLTCSFFNWFLVSTIYLVVITAVSNRCFEWRGLMYEEGGTWFVGGLGPPPPHPPPIARRLFIGFQNVPCSKSNFQRSKLQFEWPFYYNKCVSWLNWVFKIKFPLLKT